jgi:hypothetical protein
MGDPAPPYTHGGAGAGALALVKPLRHTVRSLRDFLIHRRPLTVRRPLISSVFIRELDYRRSNDI